MDDTDSNQEANADPSLEETSSFEQYTFSRELFESDSFSLSEEGKRDSVYPEYKSFIRPRILKDDHFIAVRYPLPAGSISIPKLCRFTQNVLFRRTVAECNGHPQWEEGVQFLRDFQMKRWCVLL